MLSPNSYLRILLFFFFLHSISWKHSTITFYWIKTKKELCFKPTLFVMLISVLYKIIWIIWKILYRIDVISKYLMFCLHCKFHRNWLFPEKSRKAGLRGSWFLCSSIHQYSPSRQTQENCNYHKVFFKPNFEPWPPDSQGQPRPRTTGWNGQYTETFGRSHFIMRMK